MAEEASQPDASRPEPEQAQAEAEADADAAAGTEGAEAPAEQEAPPEEGEAKDAPPEKEEGPVTIAKTEEPPELEAGTGKPSYTLHITNVPDDVEVEELEIRLKRFGELLLCEMRQGVVVAKFKHTNHAYNARLKLNGSDIGGAAGLKVEFGPQDPEHYSREKKKMQTKGRKEFVDGADQLVREVATKNKSENKTGNKVGITSKVEPEASAPAESATRRRKAGDAGAADASEKAAKAPRTSAPTAGAPELAPPAKAVSKWSDTLSFEEQLEDFMRMPRKGMYNRYLVLGKLPPELRTGEAIWRAMHQVQRDIMQVEMLTCFGKPVAHVSLRSATAAAAMHRLCEQLHPGLTVAFAPPRRASPTLWLGNVDDFVKRKELEAVLLDYGKMINGLRYLPARTCAFAVFEEVADAVDARNHLYGLEVQRNQYLNVDFVDEGDRSALDGWQGGAAWGAWGGMPPWGGPPVPPWGQQQSWGGRAGAWGQPPPPPWGAREGGRHGRGRGEERYRPGDGPPLQPRPGRSEERGGKRRRSRTRSRGRGRHREASPEPPPRTRRAAARDASEEEEPAPPPRRKAAPPVEARSDDDADAGASPKALIQLYKMGEKCCNIVANYVKGREVVDPLVTKLHIDQRTKVTHCRSHMDRAGPLATVWHFSAADRKDCAAYDALCDYFLEKQRVGLVQTPSYYVYVVPPTEEYLSALGLPSSNFVVGVQIPIKK